MPEEAGRPKNVEKIEPKEGTIDKPIMDGADEKFEGDEDPRKGRTDPALIRHPEKDDKTIAPYNI